MRPSLRSFITFFALLFCIHAVAAAPHAAVRRQDDSQAEIRSGGDITSARPTVTPSPSGTRLDSAPTPSTTPLSISPSEAPTLSTTSHVSATSTVDQSIPQSTADAAPDNPLPIQPRLNPAMGLTGVVLLISGLVYAIIGIKNKWYAGICVRICSIPHRTLSISLDRILDESASVQCSTRRFFRGSFRHGTHFWRLVIGLCRHH
ncbi:predicted protein [Plenodomus lingam JN3]|uniref:Predicted protein n=1 Tax=Leptosphaeria maculans (strain JN3 / isolate v23.1.3 / race Av1-4-5-6-7-8) TaxID=985895 RepID=E5AB29_LEPMJ|nr:predicted protein [Plenodomus lingam JN3]CBY00870.1 predicted protein [Plenodomus lingam JN3]